MVSQTILDDITRRLVAEFAPEQVILFGSQVWGEPTADSDVDLLVVIKQSDEPRYARGIRAHRALRNLPVAKDVIIETHAEFHSRATVAASLERLVRDNGRVLYG
jgi:predicted nucleotidyltransferase